MDLTIEDVISIGITKGFTEEEIREEYENIYKSDFIQSIDESVRELQALKILRTRIVAGRQTKKYTIIPIGYSMLTRSGTSTMYAFVKGQKGIKRIVCRDHHAEIWEKVEPWMVYEARLASFYDDLATDEHTNFKVLGHSNIDPETALKDIKTTTIADAPANKSMVGSDGYVIDTDWRCVRGIIGRRMILKDGRLGLYTIADETTDPEPDVLPDGTVVYPGMTVWINPALMKYDVDSECKFYGDIRVDENNIASMNAYCVIPLYVREVEE